jgi:outer membrane protein assembly factor BamE
VYEAPPLVYHSRQFKSGFLETKMPIRTILSLLCALGLSGCISYYKLDVQQGNVVTPETLAWVETGMTRQQVRFVLGTPLVRDPFHQNRWDYVYSLAKGGEKITEARRVTVFFEGDSVARIELEGIEPAATAQAPANLTPEETIVRKAGDEALDAAKASEPEKKGFFRGIWDKVRP